MGLQGLARAHIQYPAIQIRVSGMLQVTCKNGGWNQELALAYSVLVSEHEQLLL
jgi:hypothetical protein